jgi:hypothetical protein
MIIIARKTGRLGNRLKLFSHFIAFSVEHGIRVCNPSFYKYASLFRGTENSSLLCEYREPGYAGKDRCRRISDLERGVFYNAIHAGLTCYSKLAAGSKLLNLQEVSRGQLREMDTAEFVESARRRLMFVRGYGFRCDRLVRKHKEPIRQFFRPRDRDFQLAQSVSESARGGSNDLLVGVHVRHGDYARHLNGRYYFSASQYARIMQRIVDEAGSKPVRFLITTDGRLTPQDFGRLKVSISNQSPLVDLYALSFCDRILGPPSSFTEWASFYNDIPLNVISNAPEVGFEEGDSTIELAA